jgi:hypothetical protein
MCFGKDPAQILEDCLEMAAPVKVNGKIDTGVTLLYSAAKKEQLFVLSSWIKPLCTLRLERIL